MVLILFVLVPCDKNEHEIDFFSIDYKKVEPINTLLIVDTKAGWMLLNEQYGFVELIDSFHDSLEIDGMKKKPKFTVKILIMMIVNKVLITNAERWILLLRN